MSNAPGNGTAVGPTAGHASGRVRRVPRGDPAEIVDLVVCGGLAIDTFVSTSLVRVELVTFDVRIVVPDVDAYLRYADATSRVEREGDGRDGGTGTYVYAVVAADADLPVDLEPVGGSAAGVAIVEHGELAAVVSDVPVDRPLGRRADLVAHERVVDAVAAGTTVLPMRFGGVVSDDRAVIDELLARHHDWFHRALDELDGCVELVLHGRYDRDVLFGRILRQNAGIARSTGAVRDRDPGATRYERIRLGEEVAREVDGARAVDATTAEQWLGPYTEAMLPKTVDDEDAAVHLAVLVHRDRLEDLDRAVDSLGDAWAGRIGLRLVGPMAPFDFLPAPENGAGG